MRAFFFCCAGANDKEKALTFPSPLRDDEPLPLPRAGEGPYGIPAASDWAWRRAALQSRIIFAQQPDWP
ncbi:MAG: hypothetical protein QOH81_1546 [Sphingomonadales bacterium]|nr:hypothetical protein [Sphingomonadales bacterium]